VSDPSPAYVTNERYKSVSRSLFQLGSALLAAAVVKIYSSQTVTIETGSWLFVAFVVIWSGWQVLALLESEK
jgi:hypothetical protein